MTRTILRSTIGILIVGALVVLPGAAWSQGITGTAHDFSGFGWSGGEICIACHTPHDADTSVTDAPLWNHELSTATYTLYSSATLDATLGQPTGASKLCLSCHDGTIALDSFGGASGATYIAAAAEVTDLDTEHPISFAYNTTLANNDGGLFDPASDTTSLGGTIDNDLLFAGNLECASCHDAHDAAGNTALLRIDNAGSALCLTCHDK
jgi:predicted CXXCH cytochrome family protein